MGEHGDARGRDRRPPARRGARRPLPRRPPGAARLGPELLDQGRRGALRLRAHGRGPRRERVGRRLRGVARDRRGRAARRDPRLQRGGLPLALRAARLAARAAAGRARLARAARGARESSEETPERLAEREALRDASCSTARRRASRAGCSRSSSSTTAARRSRSGGRTSTPHARRGGADRGHRDDRRARARRRAGARTSSRSSTRFSFPPQEHKIGGDGVDPATERAYARRGRRRARHSSRSGAARSCDGRAAAARADPAASRCRPGCSATRSCASRKNQARYPALVEILERRPPRARLDGTLDEAALSLDGSYLFVQGPPGSGKTWNGRADAVALMQAGQRVGVTALSHKAIHKFLEEVEERARGGLLASAG